MLIIAAARGLREHWVGIEGDMHLRCVGTAVAVGHHNLVCSVGSTWFERERIGRVGAGEASRRRSPHAVGCAAWVVHRHRSRHTVAVAGRGVDSVGCCREVSCNGKFVLRDDHLHVSVSSVAAGVAHHHSHVDGVVAVGTLQVFSQRSGSLLNHTEARVLAARSARQHSVFQVRYEVFAVAVLSHSRHYRHSREGRFVGHQPSMLDGIGCCRHAAGVGVAGSPPVRMVTAVDDLRAVGNGSGSREVASVGNHEVCSRRLKTLMRTIAAPVLVSFHTGSESY